MAKIIKKRGRPSTYSDRVASEICRRIAERESLRKICADDTMPDKTTVLRWLATKENEEFRTQYAHAREMQADALFDEALEIADATADDWSTLEDGKTVFHHEHVQRSRLRVDTRKWAAGKLAPKRYGDRVNLEHTGEDGGPIQTKTEFDFSKLTANDLRNLRDIAERAAGGAGKPERD